MRFLSFRAVTAALACVVALGIVGVAYAKVHQPGHPGLSASKVSADAQSGASHVIVILRNQVTAHPATRTHIKARVRAEAADDSGVISQVQRSGGQVHQRYHTLNAFSATVSSSERSALRSNADVAAVIPDQMVRMPSQVSDGAAVAGAGSPPNTTPHSGVCPSDPAKPLLEPEALQTTHTAFTDPSTPQAQNIATGQGVKVAFFADGLDVNNPDFIRPDGSHVFIDYEDFSGDGTNAPTSGGEAFGDASSIAAQGRQVYDLSNYVNPAHPLPPGCNITVRGIAPGASLIGIKVFGTANFTFNSTILEGMDYALSVDHPDIFSESVGGYSIPDSTSDMIRQFNEQAVAAGVTVVESSGDAGVEASPSGSAASDPAVIDAGGTTAYRLFNQVQGVGAQFGNGTWLSDNISSISSAGFSQGGRVVDLVAPADGGWALCSPDPSTYAACVSLRGQPAQLEQFGGTSESAPLIAGGAALVIQAYRESHGGATPSPELVRELLASTATDLGAPSFEEGAGEMNTLAAVQAAKGEKGLLVTPTQSEIEGAAGSSKSQAFKVTNLGSTSQIVHAHARAITTTVSNQSGTANMTAASPTFLDSNGASKLYEKVTFTVPAGVDRLLGYIAWPATNSRIGMTLFDPSGAFASYSRPQGITNHGETDIAHPAAGTWTAILSRREGTFTGPIHWQFLSQDFGTVDSVSPSAVTVAPGQTKSLRLNVTLPGSAGDANQDLVFDSSSGQTTVVPLVLRSLVSITGNTGVFTGNLIGGNGRAGAPGQLNTFEFDVPRGKPSLGVSVRFPQDPGTRVNGVLIDPNGNAVAAESSTRVDGAGNSTDTQALEAYRANPQAGRWRFVMFVSQPVSGNVLIESYAGRVTLRPQRVKLDGLPQSEATKLPAGQPVTARITVHNPGPAAEDLFLDPRLPGRQAFSLLSTTPDQNLHLPLDVSSPPPTYVVPDQTNEVDASAEASEPIVMDFGYLGGDPDVYAGASGNTAAGSFSAPIVTPSGWTVTPAPKGPFQGEGAPGTVSTGLVAHTMPFDLNAQSSTGDFWQQSIDPNAPAVSPLTVAAGGKGTMTVTFTPTGRHGKIVRGTLYVDDLASTEAIFDLVEGVPFGNEVAAIPYEYKIK